jgi:hypothetical protein
MSVVVSERLRTFVRPKGLGHVWRSRRVHAQRRPNALDDAAGRLILIR